MKTKNILFYIIFIILPFYLIIGTGLHSDDYSALEISKRTTFWDFFNLSIYSKGQTIFAIFNYYLFYWAYEVLTINNDYIFDVLKILIHISSCFLFYKFSSSYLTKENAVLFTLFFIFLPLHDSSIYWYMTVPYTFTACIILYCHYLIRLEYIKTGFILLLISSFLSYSSPPYIFGASIIFLVEKKYFKFLLFIIPGLIYIFLYLLYAYNFPQIENRINDNLNLFFFIKNFTLQLLSSIDALFGPSFILKFFYSILHNNIQTLILSLLLFFSIYKFDLVKKSNFSKSLFLGLLSIYLLSLLMFSLTGLYVQSSFNLGNRTLIYGSILFSYILILLCNYSKIRYFLIIIYIVSIFGLSQFWKETNLKQKIIINDINNTSFIQIGSNSTLFIDNNLYFKLGPFDHVEFFTAPWVLESIFKIKEKNIQNISAIKKNLVFNNNTVLDIKNKKEIKLENSIFIYNSDAKKLYKVSRDELISYINKKEFGKRHWIQIINIKKLNDIIVKLSPRLYIYFNE
tara:strand:+ start:56 stop:1597 length:1542 start_codon:yes stop_codon:yes gene_type:complete